MQNSLFDIPPELNKDEWLAKAREVANQIALDRGSVTADDVREMLPVPKGVDGRTMGRVFNGMKCIGYEKSRRDVCHHRPVGRFVPETEFIDRLQQVTRAQG